MTENGAIGSGGGGGGWKAEELEEIQSQFVHQN